MKLAFPLLVTAVLGTAEACPNVCTPVNGGDGSRVECTALWRPGDASLIPLVTCGEDATGTIVHCTTPCAQKMREAMRVMNEAVNKALDKRRGDFYEMLIIALYDQDKLKWDMVVKECVQ